jgi:DNA-binding NarL/FixJ family response regulator
MSPRVLLADDHAVVRDSLRVLLEAQPDIQVVGLAANGREAVALASQLGPDVAILDIVMPELNGIEAAPQIVAASPGTQVLILSMHVTGELVIRAVRAGARGYVLKEAAGAEVVAAVRALHAGRRHFSPQVLGLVMREGLALDGHGPPPDALARLSARERQVLQLVVEGHTSAEIAARLGLSRKSVETYRSRVRTKLGLDDIPSLVKFAIQHGLTPLS